MSIVVTCPQCRASYRIADEHGGREGRCQRCGATVQVPAAATLAQGVGPVPPVNVPPPSSAAPPAEAAPQRHAGAVDSFVVAGAVSTPPAAKIATVAPAGSVVSAGAPAPRTGAERQALQQVILAAFRGNIAAVSASLTYRLGILLVAGVMVLLPLVYVAIIVLVGYGLYLHAVHDTAIVTSARGGRTTMLAAIVYAAPLVAGAILILFMIKPLFARATDTSRRRSLTRQGEPLVFAFVDRVCAAVGAPRPREIQVDCQINASAGFRRGFWSMFGNDLTLTIGAPLAAGLSLQQFAGVLAHEFGHFSQGAGMRITYVVRSISWWFTRVVYERDEWDQWLVNTAQELDLRIGVVLHLARLCVWMTRKVLWVLMMLGHVVSSFMLRQMEFDADRHEARLAGSATFESTARQLAILNIAYQGAQADLQSFYREGRLADDLPRLIQVNVGQIPATLSDKINKLIDESTTGLLATHPADKDRIASARREQAEGLFHFAGPATILFSDFDTLARNVTWDFYRGIFGPQFQQSDMHATETLLAEQSQGQDDLTAVGRYFLGGFSPLRPLSLPAAALRKRDPQTAEEEVRQARELVAQSAAAYRQAFTGFDQADTHLLEVEQARALLRADLKIPSGAFSLSLADKGTTSRAQAAAEANQRTAMPALLQFEEAAGRRLFAAIELLRSPSMTTELPGADLGREEVDRLLPVLHAVSGATGTLLELRNAHAGLAVLLNQLHPNETNQTLINAIRGMLQKTWLALRDVHFRLSNVDYPFDHKAGRLSVAAYATGALPADEDDLGAVYEAGKKALDALPALYVRLVGRMAVWAERVEGMLGLLPLPPCEQAAEAPPG